MGLVEVVIMGVAAGIREDMEVEVEMEAVTAVEEEGEMRVVGVEVMRVVEVAVMLEDEVGKKK
jgi:hypothetical protein